MGWWHRLSAREKAALLSAGVFVLLAFYYLGIWSPLRADIVLYEKRILQLEGDYRHMVQAEGELKLLRQQAGTEGQNRKARPEVGLLAEVDTSLQRGGLGRALKEIKPDGDKGVRVRLEKSPFDQVVRWLEYLRSSGIDVARASFSADAEPGHVQLTVQLRDQRS